MKTIEEKNRMIAEFMNVKFKDDNEYINELKEMRSNGIFFEQGYMTSELKYHISWDWLMPVVRSIVADTKVANDKFMDLLEVTPFAIIEDTYEAVVKFIEWYNENK